jgi:LPS-assembly lipoprotein
MHIRATHSRPAASSLFSLRLLACVALCGLIAACGFRMKGPSQLPFTTLYTNIAENSAFGANIRRAIVANSPGTRWVTEPADAEAKLIQIANDQWLRELSINAQGQVEEYELNLQFIFQVTDAGGRLVLPPTTLRATRELPYDPNAVQATQGEIATIFRDMQQSMVDRVIRRLSSPEVQEAFADAASLPVEETPVDTRPLPANETAPVPLPMPRTGLGQGPF